MFRNPNIRISNYLSNQYHVQELIILISSLIIGYSVVSFGYRYFLDNSMFFAFYPILAYALIKSYFYGRNIESGVFGYLFTAPLKRRTTLLVSHFIDIIILPSAMIIEISLLLYSKFFYIPVEDVILYWIASVAVISLFIAAGRIIGVFVRDGIVSMGVLFAVYEAISIGLNSKNKFYENIISFFYLNLFSINPSAILIESIIVLVVSILMVVISTKLLLNSGLKSGR